MSDYCCICNTRISEGDRNQIFMNGGYLSFEFCSNCWKSKKLHGPSPGGFITIAELFEQSNKDHNKQEQHTKEII